MQVDLYNGHNTMVVVVLVVRTTQCRAVCVCFMWQYVTGQCEMNSAIGDTRMCELSILGEVLNDIPVNEFISYNGQFPLWKRIMVAIRNIRVSAIL